LDQPQNLENTVVRWRTPQAMVTEAKSTVVKLSGRTPSDPQVGLADQANRWPTPCAQEDNKSPEAHLAMKARMPGGPRSTVTSLNVMSKLWQTPSVADTTGGHATRGGARSGEAMLNGQAANWPTPRASANENRTTKNAPSHGNGHGLTLAGVAISGLPAPTTPTGGDDCSPSTPTSRRLSPAFVEALMGMPPGWTQIGSTGSAASAMASCLSLWRRRSWSLLAALGFGEA